MRVPFLDLKAQYNSIKDELNPEINWVLENTSFILGEKVKNFEESFASYCNKKHCVAVNSGTSALHLTLLAYGIESGDEIITVPNTFIATVEAISYTGAKPILVDIDESTQTIDVNLIEKAITEKTKAIIPVHLFGQPANLDPIIEIARKHNLIIIEDCAQAHGSEYRGKKVPVTETGCFSFYPGKNLGAYGEGGAVLTNNEEVAKKIIMLRDHGQKEKYHHQYLGYNSRMDGFQGAVLNVKLKHLNKWTEQRREKARLYNQLLLGIADTQKEADYAKHVYHLYVVRVKEREKLAEFLKSKEIDTGIHYPIPIHLQEAYSDLGYKQGDFPISEKITNEILSLPIYPELTEEQIKHVVNSIKEFTNSI